MSSTANESEQHAGAYSVETTQEQRSLPQAAIRQSVSSSNHDENGALSRVATSEENRPSNIQLERTTTSASAAGPLYSAFSKNQKRLIVFIASWAGFFSPISGTIYHPALNPLAADLQVSNTLINLTLTSYMIFQGLAPSFFGDFSDVAGRRPAYAICFVIYIAANVGLALQNSYPALFILRCVQSTGSSATIAMCSAVVADVATPAERGKYMGFAYSGSLLGPAIGPVIGGLLADFVGWRAIFWFLFGLGTAFLVISGIFLPETARSQVGNGSIPPKGWNMSLLNILAARNSKRAASKNGQGIGTDNDTTVPRQKISFPNPLRSVYVIFDKANALLLFYNGFIFAAFYAVSAVIPSQFAEIYNFNELQIGLCYIPGGSGAVLAVLLNGILLDGNFARWCKKLNVKIRKGRDQDLSNFPIEKVRLQVAIPAAYATAICTCIFGWLIHINGPLAAVLVMLFIVNFSISVTYNVTTTLLVDFYPQSPATASAANNLVRCLLGAGFTAAVIPMIGGMGRGWTFTLIALFLIVTSPMLWVLYFWGMGWRGERREREEQKRMLKEEKKTLESGAETGTLREGEEETASVNHPIELGGSEPDQKNLEQDRSDIRK